MFGQKQTIHSVSLKTLGCKLNQSETDAIAAKFAEKGYLIKPFGQPVDLVIINTCTVTHSADSGSRAAIRQAVRSSPNARLVVTGCYAQLSANDIRHIDGVDLILGNDEKFQIIDFLENLSNGKLKAPLIQVGHTGRSFKVSEEGFISAASRTRAFIKVQEGCDYFCSYCIIPFARGRARSRSVASAVEETKKLVHQGYQEIVLTGINIGTYLYQGKKSYDLCDLLDTLQQIPGLKRIRLSSMEPNTVTDDLFKLMRDSHVICPHIHIPLQSGNDEQLKAMNRKYDLALYQNLMERFKKYLPHAALGTDLIVGFPTETERHFEKTLHVIENSPLSYLHIFRYSDRQGTLASRMTGKVDALSIKKRSQILHEVDKKMRTDFHKRNLGKTWSVLFDRCKDNSYGGYTPNYIPVSVKSKKNIKGKIINVTLNGPTNGNNCLATIALKSNGFSYKSSPSNHG